MADKKISELTTASEIKNGDNLELSQDTGSGLVSLKATILAIANKILNGINFTSDLQTTEKTVIGAINEVAQGGGGGGSSTLDGLNDVDIDDTTLADGQALVYDEIEEKWVNGQGGGGTGGHTIIDENGNSMTARAGLQFVGGANVEDDPTNNKTIVDISGGGGGFGLVQSGHTVYTLTGQNLEDRVSITFDTPFPEVPNVALSLSDPSRGQYYNPQTGLGVMNVTENGFDILIKSSSQAVAGDILIYWIATTKFSGNGIFHPVIYSTEERVIGVWKDGRPLYQKTVDFGALPNDTTKTVSYNISDLDYFVMVQCVAHNQNGSRNIPFVDDAYKSGDILLDTIKSSGVIRIIAHTDLSSLTGDVTLQYVKSTDTAGSGSWTPQGVPAVHYTTDEQVIGTWFDETLYEKTIEVNSDGNDRWTQVFNDQTADIVSFEGYVLYANGEYGSANYFAANNAYCKSLVYDSRHKLQVYPVNSVTASSKINMTIRYTKSS